MLLISQPLTLLLPRKAASAAALLTPTSLLFILALCAASAGLAWFLQTASGPGMIFRPWRKLIFGLWWKGRPRRYLHATRQRPKPWALKGYNYEAEQNQYNELLRVWKDERVQQYEAGKWWRMLYKPLGGCIYCNAPWLLMPYWFGLTAGLWGWPWLLAVAVYPLGVGVQYACVELLNDFAK